MPSKLENAVAKLFGPSFSISRGYTDRHDGVDIRAMLGTKVRALDAGTVSYARNAATDTAKHALKHWAFDGGNVVNIDLANGNTTQYAHLNSIKVNVGDQVTRGQLIGNVGMTGKATGPHLHYGLWVHGVGMINPTNYLANLAASAPQAGPQTVAPAVKATVTVIEAFDPPRHFEIPAGATIRSFDPAQPGKTLRKKPFPGGSGARASAIVSIAWPGLDPQPVPHGTFLRVFDGLFKGEHIPAALVELDAAPNAPNPAVDVAEPPLVAPPGPLPVATVTIIEAFNPPRKFRVSKGVTLRGYDPGQPGELLGQLTFVKESSASAMASVVIRFDGSSPQPVPHGRFLQVADGHFAGQFIPMLLVKLDQ